MVLGKFLVDHSPVVKQNRVHHFYPVDFLNAPINFEPQDHTHITLMGSVEKRRKDLVGFVSMIQQCDTSVRFSFIGKADSSDPEVVEFKAKLAHINCLHRVEFYDNYVNTETMRQILRKTSAILPLIHPDTSSAKEYFRHQIPGAMIVALGYKIPLLLHDSFRNIDELISASCYYTLSEFASSLEEIKQENAEIRYRMKSDKRYSVSENQGRFLTFLMD